MFSHPTRNALSTADCRTARRTLIAALAAVSCIGVAAAHGQTPWADSIVAYDPGTTGAPGFDDPATALGMPTDINGEAIGFPAAVTMFNAPFEATDVVSIGAGGELIVAFDEPIFNDPAHPFGTDLIIFGNAFFGVDFADFTINGLFDEPAEVAVSADGINWTPVGGMADSLFPTQAFNDVPMFGDLPANDPADFLLPVNPALTMADFLGLTYEEALVLYDGSGGGTPIDISPLPQASFVRISLPAGASHSAEIDAFARVPEPGSLALLVVGAAMLSRRWRDKS